MACAFQHTIHYFCFCSGNFLGFPPPPPHSHSSYYVSFLLGFSLPTFSPPPSGFVFFTFIAYFAWNWVFQEYEETCLFTKHESLQGDSPRVYPNILKCSLHSLVTKGIRLVGFATRAMVCESPTHYLILNSLAFTRGCVIFRSHFLILLLLIILISHHIHS